MRPAPTGRWTCWSRPTPRPRSRRRCSSRSPTCSTSRSTRCAFDTTSTYFETDTEEDGENALRRYGHSKDHRTDLPQIVIGLAVTRDGIPVRCWCWRGYTSDGAVLGGVMGGMRDWRLGRVVNVVDRGCSSEGNLYY